MRTVAEFINDARQPMIPPDAVNPPCNLARYAVTGLAPPAIAQYTYPTADSVTDIFNPVRLLFGRSKSSLTR